jgi:hypothetical protein
VNDVCAKGSESGLLLITESLPSARSVRRRVLTEQHGCLQTVVENERDENDKDKNDSAVGWKRAMRTRELRCVKRERERERERERGREGEGEGEKHKGYLFA